MNNRTIVPVSYYLYDMFTDNDTANCPILQNTLQIDKVVDVTIDMEVLFSTWQGMFKIELDFFKITSVSTLVSSYAIYISASNSLRRGGSEEYLVLYNVEAYPNQAPYFFPPMTD